MMIQIHVFSTRLEPYLFKNIQPFKILNFFDIGQANISMS